MNLKIIFTFKIPKLVKRYTKGNNLLKKQLNIKIDKKISYL